MAQLPRVLLCGVIGGRSSFVPRQKGARVVALLEEAALSDGGAIGPRL